MNLSYFKSLKLWKDSAELGAIILGIIASVMSIAGFSFADIFSNNNWVNRLGLIIASYVIFVFITLIVNVFNVKNGVTVKIRGITVNVKQGDIFKADGWKVIPFNEYFDTIVDDKIIAHSTLNGIFITSHVEDIDDLRESIANDDESLTLLKRSKKEERWVYPLGRIIAYQDYMLLAFIFFNEQNMAHLSKSDYERCLMSMWKEVSRIYAGRPIFLPLLGSGITRFDDIPEKSNADLLRCMLCTLKTSGENISQPITILLTEAIMKEINIYEVKGIE